MPRPGIMLYFDILEPIKVLSDADKGRLFIAILEYGQSGKVPAFDGILALAWGFVKPKIDKDSEEYNRTILKRQYATFCRDRKRKGEPDITFEEWLMTLDDGKYGADNDSSQKIQRGTRYGAGGYSATRALYSGSWCEWYHYALTTNGVIPISGGGTGGKTVAEAQAALHVTQDFLFSQLNSEGNKSVGTITSYPTKAGVYRVGNASAVTDATLPGSWGSLIIFATGYVVHIFINSSGMWFQRTENTFVPKTTWNKVTTS